MMSNEVLANTESEDLVKPLVEDLKIPELTKYIKNLTKSNVERLLEIFSKNNFQKGKIHTLLGNNDTALKEYKIALDSSDLEVVQKANYNIAILLMREKDDELEATKYLNTALEGPNLEIVQMANLNIGVILEKQNHNTLAIEHLNKALIGPGEETRQTANGFLGSIFFLIDEERSLKYFEAASIGPNEESIKNAEKSIRTLRMIIDYR